MPRTVSRHKIGDLISIWLIMHFNNGQERHLAKIWYRLRLPLLIIDVTFTIPNKNFCILNNWQWFLLQTSDPLPTWGMNLLETDYKFNCQLENHPHFNKKPIISIAGWYNWVFFIKIRIWHVLAILILKICPNVACS